MPILLSAIIINVPADQPTIQEGINVAVDGDTVLVQPDTYFENINYNGKNITVASLFLTTQDTLYISQTVIDGNQNGSVVTFESGEDSTTVLCGVTIQNGFTNNGGGIYCENSSPTLENLKIINNSAYSEDNITKGGGICCENSNPSLKEIIVSNNITFSHSNLTYGGGIYCENSDPILEGVIILNNSTNSNNYFAYGGGIYCYLSSPSCTIITIKNNTSSLDGGGIYCENSDPFIENSSISENSAERMGGGIYSKESSICLDKVIISYNCSTQRGGGIYCTDNSSTNFIDLIITGNVVTGSTASGGGISCRNSFPTFENVTITNNISDMIGGGASFYNSIPIFCETNKCNIYSNSINSSRGSGADIYSEECNMINVIVDTFTVMNPSDYYTSPIDIYTFDIQNCINDSLINSDLYVSIDGDNSNAGTDPDFPLKTINYALKRIYGDSLNHHTIYLGPGTYSNFTNGETYPLKWMSYVSLSGCGVENTILDANYSANIMIFYNVNESSIKNLKMQNGYVYGLAVGGGIVCSASSPNFENIIITDNNVETFSGGGIYCSNNSSPSFVNVIITNNNVGRSGGGICCYDSSPSLKNVLISGNSAHWGGGIYCGNSTMSLDNVIISNNNVDADGGGIYCWNGANITLINTILWNNLPQEVYCSESYYYNFITISYSDIEGGEAGIVTNGHCTVNWMEGNIDEDPLFLQTGNHPYQLTELSPCIDTGTPDTTGLFLPPWDLLHNQRVWDGDGNGSAIIDMGAYEYGAPPYVDIDDNIIVQTPEVFLHQNYPNPFNPSTTISFELNTEITEIVVFNLKGQKVKTLYTSPSRGLETRIVIWNSKDENNHPLSSGIYFYRLKTNNFEKTKKMILMK